MTPPIQWLDTDSPLPAWEQNWTAGGELTVSELTGLESNLQTNPDIRIRERCRTLLRAVEAERSGVAGATETDPHVQRLRRLRHRNVFVAKTVTQGR